MSVRLLSRLAALRGSKQALPARPAPGAPLAEVTDLRVRLGGREVLAGIGLTVRAGEVLALVGPNGAGKSTLLAALSADLPADGGEVRIDGRPVGDWRAPELALRRAVLPNRPHWPSLFRWRTSYGWAAPPGWAPSWPTPTRRRWPSPWPPPR